MKEYSFFQTFSVSGGAVEDVVVGLMGHAADYQGRHRPVADLAVHQVADLVAVSGSVQGAHVVGSVGLFVDFVTDFLSHCGGEREFVFTPVELTVTYEGAVVS